MCSTTRRRGQGVSTRTHCGGSPPELDLLPTDLSAGLASIWR